MRITDSHPVRLPAEQKRVLHLIDTLWLGGAQRLLKNIFENQQDDRNIFLYVLRKSEPSYTIRHPNVFVFPSCQRYSLAPLEAVSQFIVEHKIDILHCHLPRSIAFGTVIKRFCRRELKLVIQDHAEGFNHNLVFDTVLRLSGKLASAFVASSKANEEMLGRLLRPFSGKIRVVYSYADPSLFNVSQAAHFRADARGELGIRSEEFVAGFAGRLAQRKGWQVFAAAAAMLEQEPLRFLMTGTGPGEAELSKFIVAKGLKDKIMFLGYTENMARYYAMLDCYVLPSQWEGMPMTLLEAMSMGIPVVCSRVPGIEEFVTDMKDALLFDPGKPAELSEKLRLLAEQPALRRSIASNALETVAHYRFSRLDSELLSIYREITREEEIPGRIATSKDCASD